MKEWYFVIDVERCENCRNCFLSCKDEHVGNDWPGYAAPMPHSGSCGITITGNERGKLPFIDVSYLPQPCMHCKDAPCIKESIDNAIYRRPDGIVIIDPIKAKGQKRLVEICPYKSIFWNDEIGLPQKCTFCAHLLDDKWQQPRCVQSCPTGAMRVHYIEEKELQNIIAAEGLEIFCSHFNTKPNVYYKNLYRYTKCFVGGSVVIKINKRDECAAGADVTLWKGAQRINDCVTDTFGDFKFDKLDKNSGIYTIKINLEGYQPMTLDFDLENSVYIGNIILSAVPSRNT